MLNFSILEHIHLGSEGFIDDHKDSKEKRIILEKQRQILFKKDLVCVLNLNIMLVCHFASDA